MPVARNGGGGGGERQLHAIRRQLGTSIKRSNSQVRRRGARSVRTIRVYTLSLTNCTR